MNMSTHKMNNLYRIGAVARLTGISPDTLRIWERRYDLVDPQRSEKGGRLYSQDDVTRLTLIKTLVDQGHAISTVARLSNQELGARLGQHKIREISPQSSSQHRIAIVGKVLPLQVKLHPEPPKELQLCGLYDSLEAFLLAERDCDTLVLELPFIDRETVRALNNETLKARVPHLIVIYAFSPSPLVKRLRRMQAELHRAPVTVDQLWRICSSDIQRSQHWQVAEFHPETISEEAIPPRLFNSAQLAQLSQISTTLQCECPHHLSSIIETLIAFEEYSAQCEVTTGKDAVLHSYLHTMTAKSRWLMEVALTKLVEVEELQLDDLNTDHER